MFDGTFKSYSPQFDSLYSTHGNLQSFTDGICVIPEIYALLPKCQVNTYMGIFKLLQGKVPNFLPEKLLVDFTQAVIVAVKHVFPNSILKGCNFISINVKKTFLIT